ncbi:MAG: GreA/GreB family elongation factor [Myxococcota bacterium]
MTPSDPSLKSKLLAALRAALHAQLDALTSMVGASRDEATNAESRPENKYDTRALEASYLAAGQGERLADLKQLVAWLDALDDRPATTARLGSFVTVDDGEAEVWMLLAPQGGHELEHGGARVQLVGTASPLGQALVGAEPGDTVTFDAPSGERELDVIGVA